MARTTQFVTWAPAALLGVTCLLPGCHSTAATEGTAEIRPTYNKDTGELELITYDRDRDGRVDAWLYLEGSAPSRAELDENGDGAADRWEYYEPGPDGLPSPEAQTQGPMARGVLVRAEQDLRGDGKVSRWERYADGHLAEVSEDTDADGRPDKWEDWSGGTLQSVSLDTEGTGHATRRIVYGVEGSSPTLLGDDDGDGTFEPIRSK
jgi:hypothetical protein